MPITPSHRDLVFFGDVYIKEHVTAQFELPHNLVINLEGPLYTSSSPALGKINLASDSESFWRLFSGKLAAACLANNHIFDFGAEAYERTLRDLKLHEVEYFGAGTSQNNFNNPLFIDFHDKLVAIAGYCCASTSPAAVGSALKVAPLEVEQIARDLSVMNARKADLKLVVVHWGAQNLAIPTPADVNLARRILKLGANFIIGHHAHCIQAIERHGRKGVFYGLGNAVMEDIAVQAFFESDAPNGRPFVKKHDRRNRESIVVSVNTDTGAAGVIAKLHFRGRSLVSLPVDERKYLSWITRQRYVYSIFFSVTFAVTQIAPRIKRLLKGRQAISMKQLRNSIRVLFPKVYK
jgi:hypothetical protein